MIAKLCKENNDFIDKMATKKEKPQDKKKSLIFSAP